MNNWCKKFYDKFVSSVHPNHFRFNESSICLYINNVDVKENIKFGFLLCQFQFFIYKSNPF